MAVRHLSGRRRKTAPDESVGPGSRDYGHDPILGGVEIDCVESQPGFVDLLDPSPEGPLRLRHLLENLRTDIRRDKTGKDPPETPRPGKEDTGRTTSPLTTGDLRVVEGRRREVPHDRPLSTQGLTHVHQDTPVRTDTHQTGYPFGHSPRLTYPNTKIGVVGVRHGSNHRDPHGDTVSWV